MSAWFVSSWIKIKKNSNYIECGKRKKIELNQPERMNNHKHILRNDTEEKQKSNEIKAHQSWWINKHFNHISHWNVIICLRTEKCLKKINQCFRWPILFKHKGQYGIARFQVNEWHFAYNFLSLTNDEKKTGEEEWMSYVIEHYWDECNKLCHN